MKDNKSEQITPLKKWGSLVVLSLALAIIVIDTTVLNVSISAIIKDLKSDIQSIQWVITIYSLIIAAFTITGGRLGDLLGRKRMFIFGALVFGIGSFIASISQSIFTLGLGWSVIEGVGAALMMPATASLLVANFHGRDRAIAFGVWGGIAAAAAAIGPLLGGFLTTNVSWHWAFRINVVVVAILLGASVLIKESVDTKEKHKLDILGVILSSIGLASIVFGILESTTYGWIKAKQTFEVFSTKFDFAGLSITPIAILFGFIVMILFVLWELRMEKAKKTPLVSISIFKNKQFSLGLITTGAMTLGQTGLIFSIPIFLQAVRGFNAFQTGLGLLPLSLSLLVAAPFSAFISKKVTPKLIILIGLAINVVGILVLRSLINVDATAWTLAPGMIIYGIGMGLIMAQISNFTLSAVEIYQAGEASGINSTARQVGSTLGSAILGAIFIAALTSGVTTGVSSSKIIPDQAKSVILEKVSENSSQIEFGGSSSVSAENVPAAITDEITKVIHQSTVDANKRALEYTALFLAGSFVVALGLPNKKAESKKDMAMSGH